MDSQGKVACVMLSQLSHKHPGLEHWDHGNSVQSLLKLFPLKYLIWSRMMKIDAHERSNVGVIVKDVAQYTICDPQMADVALACYVCAAAAAGETT